MRALHTPIRRQHLIDRLLGALVAVLLLALYPSTALAASGEAPVNPAVLAKAVDQMEQLDRMRIAAAATEMPLKACKMGKMSIRHKGISTKSFSRHCHILFAMSASSSGNPHTSHGISGDGIANSGSIVPSKWGR